VGAAFCGSKSLAQLAPEAAAITSARHLALLAALNPTQRGGELIKKQIDAPYASVPIALGRLFDDVNQMITVGTNHGGRSEATAPNLIYLRFFCFLDFRFGWYFTLFTYANLGCFSLFGHTYCFLSLAVY